jgi:periplasmic divalent cation tolerance protein
MESSDYIVLLITTGSHQEAQKISRRLLERRKVACVNIAPVDSAFWWESELDSAQERLLIAKTRASLLPDIIDLVKKDHSYEVPEVIALPIVGGNPDYLKWIDDSVA